MSLESAKKFVEKMKVDKIFARDVTKCEDAEKRMGFVKSKGFDFTKEELSMAIGALDDSMLASAAGGDGRPDRPSGLPGTSMTHGEGGCHEGSHQR